MAKVRKTNPITGEKEWVATRGSIARMGGNPDDQFGGQYSYGKDKKASKTLLNTSSGGYSGGQKTRPATQVELDTYREGDTVEGGGFLNPLGQIVYQDQSGMAGGGVSGGGVTGSKGKDGVFRYTSGGNTPLEQLMGGMQTDFTDRDAEKIREARYRGAQGMIDSINERYAGLDQKVIQEGKETQARNRAIQSRSGLIGSGRGMGQVAQIDKYTNEERRLVEQQRNQEIQFYLGEIDKLATQEIEARRAEIAGNRTAYVDFLKEQTETVKSTMENLAGLGVSIDELDPADVDDFKKYTGWSDIQLRAYWDAKADQANKVDYKYEVKDGMLIQYGTDPKTGQTVLKTEKIPGLSGQVEKIGDTLLEKQPDGSWKPVYGGGGGGTSKEAEIVNEGKKIVDDMINSKDYEAIGGYSTKLGGQFGTRYGDARAKAEQLSAILAKENLGLLKGPMSDKDLAFIKSMSTGFEGQGTQSEEYIKGRLEEIQKKLDGRVAELGSSNVVNQVNTVLAPDGQEVEIID